MAEEVYRIEIPVMVEDHTEPALSNAEKKVSQFDKTVERTRNQLDGMNRTRWQLALHALDRASSVINSVGTLARRIASGAYRITVRVVDMATAPFRAILRGLNSALGILGIGAGAAGAIVVPLKMVIQQQNIETAFEVLLGSAEAAKKRVAELTDFAGQTPYTRDEIYEASRVLQVFTGNALSTADGLRLVGDIAAGTQKDFSDVALWMGRLYDAMASGRPVGMMTSSLQDMGAISGAARDRLEKLAASGQNISKTWPKAVQEFARFDGMMGKLSDNLANLLLGVKSFFMNNIIKRWGQGLTAGITPLLQSFRQWRKENAAGIAKMGDQVEQVASRMTKYFVDRIQTITRRVRALFNDQDFKNADLFGKVKIAWDKIISEPFSEWWAGGGKERIDHIAASIGGALGSGLHSILMGLLGMATDKETKISDSPFIEAGASAGRSFLEAFLEAFDAGEIAKKAKEAFLNIQPTWLGGETSSGTGQALALLLDAWMITKVGRILKGPATIAKGMSKGIGTARRLFRGGSATAAAAEAAPATAAVATRAATTATAAEAATKGLPWYRRMFGAGNAATAVPVAPTAAASAIPMVETGLTAQYGKNYKPAGKQFWDNIPLEQTYKRDDIVSMANAGELKRYNDLEKAFGRAVPEALPKVSWWKTLLKSKAFTGVSKVAGKAAVPIGLGLDAVSIAAADPGKERNKAIGSAAGGWGGFAAGAAGGAAIGSVVPVLGTAVGGILGGIIGGLGGSVIGDWIGGQWEDFSSWITGSFWPSVTSGASKAWDGIKRGAGATWDWISDTAPQAIARGIGFAVGYIGGTLFNADWWSEKWAAVQAWGSASWESAKETWNSVKDAIGSTVFSGEWWSEQWAAVQAWSDASWESAKETWNSARDAINSTLFDGDWWKSKWDAVTSWASSAWESIKGGWGKFWDKVGSAFSEGKEAGQAAASGKAYARGGLVTRPHLGLVGEAGPEAIIPLSAGMRGRGFELWQQAGEMLGVQPYAMGGIVGPPQMAISAPVIPFMGQASSPSLNMGGIHLGGVQISFKIDGAGADILEAIREHGDEIADELADKIGRALDEATQNTV